MKLTTLQRSTPQRTERQQGRPLTGGISAHTKMRIAPSTAAALHTAMRSKGSALSCLLFRSRPMLIRSVSCPGSTVAWMAAEGASRVHTAYISMCTHCQPPARAMDAVELWRARSRRCSAQLFSSPVLTAVGAWGFGSLSLWGDWLWRRLCAYLPSCAAADSASAGRSPPLLLSCQLNRCRWLVVTRHNVSARHVYQQGKPLPTKERVQLLAQNGAEQQLAQVCHLLVGSCSRA